MENTKNVTIKSVNTIVLYARIAGENTYKINEKNQALIPYNPFEKKNINNPNNNEIIMKGILA